MTPSPPHNSRERLRQKWHHNVDKFRYRLAHHDALPQLTLLGLLSGILAALVIVAFRLLIDWPLNSTLPLHSENFESLPAYLRFALPVAGAIVIGLLLQSLNKRHHSVSVGHVLDRLHNHQGQLPLTNIVVQFFGGILSLISGQSVGREGPAVHLGAGTASQLGQYLKLPNNSLRTLSGCGVAAAIAASFNTPMAGVIFAMEVVLMEYTIAGFIPVILASVSGAAISQLVFGESSVLSSADIQMNSLWELPYFVFGGLVIATCAAIYIRMQLHFQSYQKFPVLPRLAVAGLFTGSVAVFVPQVMGLGYDTVADAMNGSLGINLLLIIIAAKLLVTTFGIGLGIPGGVIGPSLFLGACIGGVIGIVGNALSPEDSASTGFYVTLGMATMMGAVLNAPLAALMTILELTYNPNIIFPSMLMIVVACFATRQFFHCEGIFQAQLRAGGKTTGASPSQQILSRVGVRSVMNTAFATCSPQISINSITLILQEQPLWIVVEDTQTYLLRAADLARHLKSLDADNSDEQVDINEIPAKRLALSLSSDRDNLYEAQGRLIEDNSDALAITRGGVDGPILGIITSDTILNYYRV